MILISLFTSNICIGSIIKSSDSHISNSHNYRYNYNDVFLNNNILNVGGTGYNNYTTIQLAINNSEDGDIIFVWEDSSPYYENVLINKKISLIGENKFTTIIDGKGINDVISVDVDDVYISGFSIINSGTDWIDSGIKLNSDNNLINGNIIYDNNFGIYSYDLKNSCILNNIIRDNYDSGIHLPFSNNITISNNTITNNLKKGIFLYDSNVHCNIRNSITDNIIKFNKYGIYFWFSYRTDISSNNISNNENGISFNHNSEYNSINNNTITQNKWEGIFLNSSSYNQIINNEITYNKNGINLKYSSDCYILKNRIVGYNDIGLYLNYSSHAYINNNYFSSNNIYGLILNHSTKNYFENNYIIHNKKIGLYLINNSNDNTIQSNNFINKLTNSFFENTFRNKWSNNFWDNWNKQGFYIIHGKIYLLNDFITLNWINFDLKPSKYENK